MRLLALAVLLGACGTPPPSWLPDAGPCAAYMTPANLDLTTPTISFAHDVMPVFAGNCSSASCHGATGGAAGSLFLGAESAHGSDASRVYTKLQQTSAELKAMAFVTASDPAQSYLMRKLDGDQCLYSPICEGHDCRATMPYGSAQLSEDQRDTVRRWIAQGAAQN